MIIPWILLPPSLAHPSFAFKLLQVCLTISQVEKLEKDISSLAKKDDEFRKKMVEALKETSPEKKQEMLRNTLQEYFPHYFTDSNVFERHTFKVTQDTADTHHIVLPSLPDDFGDRGVPKDMRQLGPDKDPGHTNQGGCTSSCGGTCGCCQTVPIPD